MQDGAPLISLVIPTRERANTLVHTLRTAIEQDEADCEILVCDNFSCDNTRSVVESFSDPRLRYVNSGQRLPMSENWNFAIRHARGRYVIIIGDDDGVMPGALRRLHQLISSRPAKIYYWQGSGYSWPIDGLPPAIWHVTAPSKPKDMDLARSAKFSVRWGGWRYISLPLAYHSAVARELFDEMLLRTGKVFHSINPDVFTGFALPALCAYAVDAGESYTVYGSSSAKSKPVEKMTADDQAQLQRVVDEYGDYRLHPTLHPGLSSLLNIYGDSALKAMDFFPDFYRDTKFDYSAMYAFAHRMAGKALLVRRTLAMRREIQKRQPFSATRFLLIYVLHKLMAYRVSIRRAFITNRYTSPAPDLPQDIHALVHYLASMQSRT